jgi:hypothetical protein
VLLAPSLALRSLACLFPNHIGWALVFADSEKDRMPKTIISGPLCEFHLADHRRSNPMTTLHFGSGQPMIPKVASVCRKIRVLPRQQGHPVILGRHREEGAPWRPLKPSSEKLENDVTDDCGYRSN